MRHSDKTTQLCLFKCLLFRFLHPRVSGSLCTGGKFSFVPLWALRQSCTEWWLSERITSQPAAGPPWLVNSRVSEETEIKEWLRQRAKRRSTSGKVNSEGLLTRSEVFSGVQPSGHTGVLVASGQQATALMYNFKSRSSSWFTSP